jgi:hypothetical protein
MWNRQRVLSPPRLSTRTGCRSKGCSTAGRPTQDAVRAAADLVPVAVGTVQDVAGPPVAQSRNVRVDLLNWDGEGPPRGSPPARTDHRLRLKQVSRSLVRLDGLEGSGGEKAGVVVGVRLV